MQATVLNCSLKSGEQVSNTQLLADSVIERLSELDVTTRVVRVADHAVPPGVQTDLGSSDGWPDLHRSLLESQILVIASPTWVGRPSSVAQRVLERMDAMISETDDAGVPVAYNRVAGVVATGNEDGAHHVISEVSGALNEIGYTVPAQAWTYWNRGPGPGPGYSDTDEGHDWSLRTARTMADNLVAVARALEAHPITVSEQ